MINPKNIPFYLICILIFLILKFGFTRATHSNLKFLLAPTSKIVETATGTDSEFIDGSGYFNQKLNIIIDKSCSGFNFLVLCFISLSFTAFKYLKTNIRKLFAIIFLLIASWFITIFVNASRILFSVFVHNQGFVGSNNNAEWMHQAEGVFVYLFFLILIHLIFNYLLNKIFKKHAQPS